MKKFELNRIFQINRTLIRNKGFSLLELMIVLIITTIVLGTCLSIYKEFMRSHTRQSRAMLVERSIRATELALRDSLASLPGRGFGVSNGAAYSIPLLPFAGFIYDGTGNKPIRLGIITPYKINGNDAFTLAYSEASIPRLPVESITSQTGNIKTFRVPLPTIDNTQIGLGIVENSKDSRLPTSDPKPDFEANPNPNNSNLSTSIATVETFKQGQLMLILEAPAFNDTSTQPKQSIATLVRLISVVQANTINRQFLQFTCEICSPNNGCSQLTNDPAANANISSGTILAPLKLTSFYLKKDSFGNKLIRNDDGIILPTGSDSFAISGGNETIVGETDTFTVNYHLKDGSIASTPNTPLVTWLGNVLSVDVIVGGAMNGTQGTDYFDRSAKLNFPIITKNLE